MIRWISLIPISEKYFDESKFDFFENFLIKRRLYSHKVPKKRFIFFKTKQLTLDSLLSKDESILLKNINKKFRYEIRQFSKLKENNKNFKIEINEQISAKLIEFLISYYRGQKPNINKLKDLTKENKLLIFSLLYKDNYLTTLIWLKTNRQARLLYNVLNRDKMKSFNCTNSNKYIMYISILNFSKKEFSLVDLGGITTSNNQIDRFKKGFSKGERFSYNYFHF